MAATPFRELRQFGDCCLHQAAGGSYLPVQIKSLPRFDKVQNIFLNLSPLAVYANVFVGITDGVKADGKAQFPFF